MIDFKPSVPQAWFLLALAIVLEVCGTTSLKLSEGFTRMAPSVLIFVFYGLSFTLNSFVVRTLDLSVTYGIWAGCGTALAAIVGFVYFKEPATALKLASIGLIVIGVLGLNTASRLPA
jgi:small multidrug resistance pump